MPSRLCSAAAGITLLLGVGMASRSVQSKKIMPAGAVRVPRGQGGRSVGPAVGGRGAVRVPVCGCRLPSSINEETVYLPFFAMQVAGSSLLLQVAGSSLLTLPFPPLAGCRLIPPHVHRVFAVRPVAGRDPMNKDPDNLLFNSSCTHCISYRCVGPRSVPVRV